MTPFELLDQAIATNLSETVRLFIGLAIAAPAAVWIICRGAPGS